MIAIVERCNVFISALKNKKKQLVQQFHAALIDYTVLHFSRISNFMLFIRFEESTSSKPSLLFASSTIFLPVSLYLETRCCIDVVFSSLIWNSPPVSNPP